MPSYWGAAMHGHVTHGTSYINPCGLSHMHITKPVIAFSDFTTFCNDFVITKIHENRERSIKSKIKTMIKVRVRLDTIGHWLYNKLTRDRKGHSLFQPFRFGVFLSWGSAILLNICKVFHCPLWRCLVLMAAAVDVVSSLSLGGWISRSPIALVAVWVTLG